MRLTKIAKDSNSRDGSCPAVYVSPDDAAVFVAQGKVLDENTFDELQDRADDETAVLVPIETMVNAVDQWVAANPARAREFRVLHTAMAGADR